MNTLKEKASHRGFNPTAGFSNLQVPTTATAARTNNHKPSHNMNAYEIVV